MHHTNCTTSLGKKWNNQREEKKNKQLNTSKTKQGHLTDKNGLVLRKFNDTVEQTSFEFVAIVGGRKMSKGSKKKTEMNRPALVSNVSKRIP